MATKKTAIIIFILCKTASPRKAELYLNPAFKGLRKKRLAESIRTGRKWKNYSFDIMEVNE